MSILSDHLDQLKRERDGTATPLDFLQVNVPPVVPEKELSFGAKANVAVGKFADFGSDFITGALRAPFRAVGQFTINVQEAIANRPSGDITFRPTTTFDKFIFGTEPIKDIETTGRKIIEEFGISEEQARKFGPGIGIGLFALDIFPAFPGKKKIAKATIFKIANLWGDDVAKQVIKLGDQKLATVALTKRGGNALRRAGIDVVDTKAPINNVAREIKRKIVQQKFRSDKLNLAPQIIKGIERRLNVLGLEQRTVRTFAEMEEAAKLLGTDPEILIKAVAKDRITDGEVIALKNLIKDNAEFVVDMEQRIIKNADAELTLAPKIAAATRQIDGALKKLIKGGTEAGRTIAAFRIMAKNTMDPEFWLRQARKSLDGPLDEATQRAIFSLIKSKDRNGLAALVSGLRQANASEKIVTLWKAGLLTNITTHMANTIGNTTMAVLMTASDVAALPFDVLMAMKTGKRTVVVTPSTILAKFKATKAGLKSAKEFLRTGIYDQNLLLKWDIPKTVNFNNKFLNGYTQAVFRSLGAEDIFFRKLAMGEAMEKSAILLAKNDGLTGKAAKVRIKELLMKPTNEMVANGIDAAEFGTFTNKNAVADAVTGWKRALQSNIRQAKATGRSATGSQITLTATEFIAPFTKTPTNIAGRIVDFSPIGFVKAVFKVLRPSTRSQLDFARDMGRALTGTGIMGLGGYMASKGLITGNAPTNVAERAQFYAEGKQPNSIRFGDKWLSLNRTSPFGNLLTIGANFNQLSQDKEGMDLIVSSLGAGVKGLTEQTFLKGVSNSLKAINNPERNSESFIAQSIASIIPAIVGKGAQTIDPTMRVPDGIIDTIKTRIPIISKQVAARRDIFGNLTRTPGGRAALIDPFSMTKAIKNPIIDEAKRLDISIGIPNKKVDGIEMDEHEFSLYQKVQGKILQEALKKLIANEQYKKMDDVNKEVQFKSIIRKAREAANNLYFPALMIQKFDLPEDTNPSILRILLKQASQEDFFNKFNDEKKGRALRAMMDQIELQ